jgi:hypothetical protein
VKVADEDGQTDGVPRICRFGPRVKVRVRTLGVGQRELQPVASTGPVDGEELDP